MDVKPPVHVPEGDKRFADPAWRENPAFFAVRQGYLAAPQLVSDLLAAGAGDLAGDARARLATGFLLDALAPAPAARPARGPGPRRPATQALIPGPGALGPPRTAARGGRTGRRGPAPAGERERAPAMGSGRHQAIADATGSSARPTASEVHHG
jgi:hypothetical protein